MRNLLKSFSIAALFSLATACAVEDPTESESITKDDDVECVECRNPEEIENGESKEAEQELDKRRLPELEVEVEFQPYCEQNYDCESNICDQEINRCRNYPF